MDTNHDTSDTLITSPGAPKAPSANAGPRFTKSTMAPSSRSIGRFLWVALLLATFTVACDPEYPNCEEDEDCNESEYCVMNMCQQCRNTADCGAGQQCNDGRCDPIEGYCQSTSDCQTGEECRNNRCIAQASTDTSAPADDDLTASEDGGPCASSPIYFAFDSSTIDSQARSSLTQTAECLKKNPSSKLHLTGHADPRGTEEYNLALGDRRARSVQEYISALGVEESRLTTSSMGEELASEDEGTWDQNRRVEFAQN